MGWRPFSLKNEAASVHIHLLGAPGTGKTRLAAEMTKALSAGSHDGPLFTVEDNPALPHANPAGGATLLMGLDLPAPPAFAALQQAADRALRDALALSGISYQVIYGQGEQRLHSALAALQGAGMAAGDEHSRARWTWACDNCSDPQCERRLLTDLLAARA
jgi:hypothetical protein